MYVGKYYFICYSIYTTFFDKSVDAKSDDLKIRISPNEQGYQLSLSCSQLSCLEVITINQGKYKIVHDKCSTNISWIFCWLKTQSSQLQKMKLKRCSGKSQSFLLFSLQLTHGIQWQLECLIKCAFVILHCFTCLDFSYLVPFL